MYAIVYLVLLALAVIYNNSQIELMGYPSKGVGMKRYKLHQLIWHVCQGVAMAIVVTFFEFLRCESFQFVLGILVPGSILFDLGLNLLRRKPIFYVGKTAPTDLLTRWIAKKLDSDIECTGLAIRGLLLIASSIISIVIW